MVSFLAATAALAFVAALSAKMLPRLPESVCRDLVRTARFLQLRAGGYSLKTLMQSMVDEMLGSVLPSIARSYVPANMRFGLHPQDARRWGDYFPELARELRDLMLAEVASRPDLELKRELHVSIVEDTTASPGRPSFCANMAAPDAAPSLASPNPKPVRSRETRGAADAHANFASDDGPTRLVAVDNGAAWCLAISGRTPVPLWDTAVVGRGDSADVRIEHDELSRAHARFHVAGERVTIVDLGSTNGTRLNGVPVGRAVVRSGDVISFGHHVNGTLQRPRVDRPNQPPTNEDSGRTTHFAATGANA